MSLFKVNDIFSKTFPNSEEFAPNSLAIMEVDGTNHLIVGSLNGSLRIFNPESDDSTEIMEKHISLPILQLAVGKFVPGTTSSQVAVLCPRHLKVFHYNASNLDMQYEHNLQRSAYCMTVGLFGGIEKDREFICVQSMDGYMEFFEQETPGVKRCLPNVLIPSPAIYLTSIDSFICPSSTRYIYSYKYEILASASDSRTVKPSWSFNCGENIIDIKGTVCGQYVLALGERYVHCLNSNGSLKFSRKLTYAATCIFPISVSNSDDVTFMIGTNTKYLIIYKNNVVWTCQLSCQPMTILVSKFKECNGYVVIQGMDGELSVNYLGTNPELLTFAVRLETREINYEKSIAELKELNNSIKSHGGDVTVQQTMNKSEPLAIKVIVPQELDRIPQSAGSLLNVNKRVPSVTVDVKLCSKIAVNDVVVTFAVKQPLGCNQSIHKLPLAGGSEPTTLTVSFFMQSDFIPHNLEVQIAATYKSTTGNLQVANSSFMLPLALCCTRCLPVKVQEHKITIEYLHPMQNLSEIFHDFGDIISSGGEDNNSNSSSAIAFQFLCGGPIVTILMAAKSNRYRFQSDVFEAMWPCLNAFVDRLAKKLNLPVEKVFSYQGQLPVDEFVSVVALHYEYRLKFSLIHEALEQRATQLRIVQKRLLTKYAEKNPSTLNNLDLILEGTYRQIVALANAAEENENDLVRLGCALSGAVNVLILLGHLLNKFSNEELALVKQIISPVVLNKEGHQGWQERTEVAVVYYLKSSLSKGGKEDSMISSNINAPCDVKKLGRHIKIFFDRLAKGGTLIPGHTRKGVLNKASSKLKKPKVADPILDAVNELAEEEEEKSIGINEEDELSTSKFLKSSKESNADGNFEDNSASFSSLLDASQL